jgi:hypothetical protein
MYLEVLEKFVTPILEEEVQMARCSEIAEHIYISTRK